MEKESTRIETPSVETTKNNSITNKTVLVTGVTGQLGYDVVSELANKNYNIIASARKNYYDIINKAGLKQRYAFFGNPNVSYQQLNLERDNIIGCIETMRPDVIIHCAAWTNVDDAEDPVNRDAVFGINYTATKSLAIAAKKIDAVMIYISTDYVFDGKGERPWEPDDKCFGPLNVYGMSKLEGEKAVSDIVEKFYIVRISWVFGLNGKNFIKTMINVGQNHDCVRVVCDQMGNPTYTRDLAKLLGEMVESNRYGYYHASSEGDYISWYDYCKEIYELYGINSTVIPVTTEEYGISKAQRPKNSRLNKKKLSDSGFTILPDWKDAVSRYLIEAKLFNV